MNYSKSSLRADLQTLGVSTWDWGGAKPDQVRKEVRASNPTAKAGSFEEILEYCWKAYEKALRSRGDLVIGRVENLAFNSVKEGKPDGELMAGAGFYEKVANMVRDDSDKRGRTYSTLFDKDTEGNLLSMDKWARVVNDSWILGGVHRQGVFRLASPRVFDNLWNAKGFFIVTARELLGLLNFGYALEQVGPWQCLMCRNKVRATTADLLKYDAIIKKGQTVEQAMKMVDAEGSDARAEKQVLAARKK